MYRQRGSRKRQRISGKSKWLAPVLSAGFAAGATALGYGALAPAASVLGGYVGNKIKQVTGFGDYHINKNALIGGMVPKISNPSLAGGGLTISHREYLGDVISSETTMGFSITKFNLNPGQPQTWEWLAQIACNYEEWIPEGILFCFKSTSGDALNSTNTALGTVIMATNYNPYNAPFATKAEMESYEFCSSGPPSADLIHPVECDPTQGSITTYYVRPGLASSGQDQRFSDLGTFYIATTGVQGTSIILGELWVTYQITLLKPKLFQSLGDYNDYAIWSVNSGATAALPFGTSGLVQNQTNMPIDYYSGTSYYDSTGTIMGDLNGTKLTFQSISGTGGIWEFPCYAFDCVYLIRVVVEVSANGTTPTPTWSYAGTFIPVEILKQNNPAPGATANRFSTCVIIRVPGQTFATQANCVRNGVQLAYAAPAAPTHAEWRIIQLPHTTTQ